MSESESLNGFEKIFKLIGKSLIDEISRYRKHNLLIIPDLITHLKNFTPKFKNKLPPFNFMKK
jgi:hypothetical protein